MLTLSGFLKNYNDLHVLIKDDDENVLYPKGYEEVNFFNKILSYKCDENGFYVCNNMYYYYDSQIVIENNQLYLVETLMDVTNFAQNNIMAMTDVITNLSGRRLTYDRFNVLIGDAINLKKPFACIMGDADFFKKVNDTYGHYCGDEILKKLASILFKNTRHRNLRGTHAYRGQDIVGRVGGEEFLVVLNNISLVQAYNVIDRIRKEIEKTVINYDNKSVKLCTMSFGLCYVDNAELEHYKSIESLDIDMLRDELIKKSDEALYRSKESGRNCISVYGINNNVELNDAIFTRQLSKH